jgi:hypothetical protein
VSITRNYLADSAQEIFIQPEFGPIDDILIENNLLTEARAYAVQSQATTGLRFINNTVWDSKYGMTIRRGPKNQPPATDGVVVGNIIDRLGYPAGTQEEYNLIGESTRPEGYGSHDLLSVDPLFVGNGDYSLQPDSPAVNAGHPQLFPALDLRGVARSSPPSMGAFEVAGEEPLGPPVSAPPKPPKKAAQDRSGSSERSLRIALQLPGHGRVTVRRHISVPNICGGNCRVLVKGAVTVFAGSKPARRHKMRLHPVRLWLSEMVRHGMRLRIKNPKNLRRDQTGGPVHALAKLVLRFAPGSPDEVRRRIVARFAPRRGRR